MVQTTHGQVGQQTAECDTNQQQGLELFHDGQIQQHAGDGKHHQVLPTAISKTHEHCGKAGIVPQVQQNITNINHGCPP